jgi:hypothetical protein
MSFHDLQPTVSWNPRTLGWLGDDTSTLIALGFDDQEVAQITSAHQSCSLSPQGYSYLLTGAVDPSTLANFLANDPGCAPGQPAGGGRITVPDVNIQLSQNPAPTVAEPGFAGWLAQNTTLALALVAGAFLLFSRLDGKAKR